MFYIVGLGNKGEEYENTRHNTGRIAVLNIAQKNNFPDFKFDKKSNSLISKGVIEKKEVCLIMPETFMNKSGASISYFIKPKTSKNKSIDNILVIYDDLDLELGNAKISYNKSSGGHNGLLSIIKSLKTEEFARIRIGVSDSTPKGKIKKPKGEKVVLSFILGKFKEKETEKLKSIFKKINETLKIYLVNGREKATNYFN